MPENKEKLVLSTRDFYYLIEIEKIIYCKSDNSYTTFHMVDGEQIRVSVPIKSIEQKLDSKRFFRPHQSYLVNVHYVKSIKKGNGGDLVLINGKTITISSRKKGEVLHFLENIKRIQA
jgi:two-component system LytT family response regulator